MLGGVAATLAGIGLMLDDAKDLGQFSTKDHPLPFHHWQWGLLMMLIGLGAASAGAVAYAAKQGLLDKERLREALEELEVLSKVPKEALVEVEK